MCKCTDRKWKNLRLLRNWIWNGDFMAFVRSRLLLHNIQSTHTNTHNIEWESTEDFNFMLMTKWIANNGMSYDLMVQRIVQSFDSHSTMCSSFISDKLVEFFLCVCRWICCCDEEEEKKHGKHVFVYVREKYNKSTESIEWKCLHIPRLGG